jgi:putative ABC transport system substrate-binding protein
VAINQGLEYHTATRKESMSRSLHPTLALALGATVLVSALADAEPEPSVRPSSYALARLVVVRQPGVWTYEELIDEFRGLVRASVRVVGAHPGEGDALRAWLRRYRPRVVLAVGQSAYDELQAIRVPLVSVLALHRPPAAKDAAVALTIPTTAVLAAFRAARPGIGRLGALAGRGAVPLLAAAQAEASLLGFELLVEVADSPERAISSLQALGQRSEGIWLIPDLQVLSPQVLQYALMVQFRRRLPVLGATRRHTRQGTLFALDHDPEDLGRQAALFANQLLAGERPQPAPLAGKLSLNLTTAQRIGVDSVELRRAADRVYQ